MHINRQTMEEALKWLVLSEQEDVVAQLLAYWEDKCSLQAGLIRCLEASDNDTAQELKSELQTLELGAPGLTQQLILASEQSRLLKGF